MVKISKKRKAVDNSEESVSTPQKVMKKKIFSDELPRRKPHWTNRQRVLVLATRGINHRDRHLMQDIKNLMPHHRPESKMERTKTLSVINEMCEMKNCNKAILFEGRKQTDLYMWLANVPNGPSVKFFVENVYTMDELKLTGNCLKGSRPILSFSPEFTSDPHYSLLKELIQQIFAVPNHHPKSQPFFDHVFTFTILDKRIWFRNYQILSEDGALAEIGPRCVLNPIKVFSGSFGGEPLWENPAYMSPAKCRQILRKSTSDKYVNRVLQKQRTAQNAPKNSYKLTFLHDIFDEDETAHAEQQNGTTIGKQAKRKKHMKRNKNTTDIIKTNTTE